MRFYFNFLLPNQMYHITLKNFVIFTLMKVLHNYMLFDYWYVKKNTLFITGS